MLAQTSPASRFLIDISTSLWWKGRNAVGIVRTEREIAKHFLENVPAAEFFYYERDEKQFRLLPKKAASELLSDTVNLSKLLQDGTEKRSKHPTLFRFKKSDVVISAGLLWDLDYMAALYREKVRCGMYVTQVVYDIIPALMPEYCVPGMEKKFPKFLIDAAWTCDTIFSISDSTRNDLTHYYQDLGLKCPNMKRINLGTDIPTVRSSLEGLAHDLQSGKFVLYVSTIEPRKNHQMLFNIWRELHRRGFKNLVPLVFVGGKGWNSENLVTFMENCPDLYPDKLKIYNNISDHSLDWMYRNSRFTVYPSLYEGWGLPVTESLSRGKVCISSETSSMPEAGSGFADLLHPLDYVSWRDRIATYLSDDNLLRSREAEIRQGYEVTTWRTCVSQFADSLFDAVNDRPR
jgi:glycosyltransferase involved in cell wall biosynthesis